MTAEIVFTVAFLTVSSAVWAVAGVRAWTGGYRAWAPRGWGYRILAGAFFGPGMLLFGLGAVVGQVVMPVGGVLFGLGVLLMVIGFLFLLLVLFTNDRFYPRWYRELPEDERQW